MNSLPKSVTRQRRGCDLNPGPTAPESSTLTTRLPSHHIKSRHIESNQNILRTFHYDLRSENHGNRRRGHSIKSRTFKPTYQGRSLLSTIALFVPGQVIAGVGESDALYRRTDQLSLVRLSSDRVTQQLYQL